MSKLVKLSPEGKIVFVGDTHGDYRASKQIMEKFLSEERKKIVFLGDYVDRGEQSKENADFLLQRKKENPEKVYLLQGNHDTYSTKPFSPADFGKRISPEEYQYYKKEFLELPLVVSTGNIIALHGGLPKIKSLDEIEQIEISESDLNWMRIVWGDFLGFTQGDGSEVDVESRRPFMGEKYFNEIMGNLDKAVLIRGHDYNAPQKMYNNRCLTLFTSEHYHRRKIAIADFDKHPDLKNPEDIQIKNFR